MYALRSVLTPLEGVPVALAEELVLEVSEGLPGGPAVQAVAPSGYALGEAGLHERRDVEAALALPSHVGAQD